MQVSQSYLDELERKAAVFDKLFLCDFTKTLISVVESNCKTVWDDPKTGKKKCSIAGMFEALEYDYRGSWAAVKRVAALMVGYEVRHDLPNGSYNGTACIFLDDIETFITTLQPRKGVTALEAFKEKHGVTA